MSEENEEGLTENLCFLIADDHRFIRETTKIFLKADFPHAVSLEAKTHKDVLEIVREKSDIDLILLDLKMPGMDGLEAIRSIRALDADVKILIVSGECSTERVRSMIEAGAQGFFSKQSGSAGLILAMRYVLAGETYLPNEFFDVEAKGEMLNFARQYKLSAREMKIIELISDGLSNRQIAEQLSLAEGSVKLYTNKIYKKTGTSNRVMVSKHYYDAFVDEHGFEKVQSRKR